MSDSPLLSIGMIVKNEERCLEKCLKALQPLREAIPCQLVIADTGSTDATRDIAARYADILFDFPWVNDFSAARNAVLDRCTGKWYLTVDADEYLDSDFHELTDFLTGPEADQYSRGCVNQYSYPDIEMKEDGVDFLAPRMARLSTDLRYFGSIHEAFPGVPITQVKILAGVKLHHDGYAADPKHPERARHKSERYLDLLDAELKKSPHNLRRLLQCVEASPQFPARHIEYVRKAMHALRKACQTGNHNDYGPAICRYALMAAVGQQMPELEAWWQWSRQTFPHSMFLRLDGNFILLDWYTQQRQYEKVPELAEAYLTAWRDYQERNFDLLELLHSALYRTGQKDEAHARASGGLSLAHLGRLSEAAELLAAEPDWTVLKPADLRSLLTGCAWAAKENLIQSIVADAAEAIFALPGRDGQERQDALRLTAAWLFQPRSPGPETPESPWCVFLKVRGALGLAARIMETDSTVEMRELLFSVDCWKDFPAPALSRILEQRLPLPESFYHISSEELAAFAAALAQGGIRFARTAADWLTHQPPAETPGELTWQLDLAAAALRTSGWEEEIALGETLCALFQNLSQIYLTNFYNPELLNDDDLPALPSLHRFGWQLWQAVRKLEGGDELGYVQTLRAALKDAPAMKQTVAFLSEHRKKTVITPELASLAEKIHTILEQYPPDDPQVLALKNSAAYQQVSSLLEQQGTPAAPREPTAPEVADVPVSLIDQILSGSRAEIETGIAAAFARLSEQHQARLADYWRKYPLWGETPQAVRANAAAALSAHREDFLWMFRRLADNTSRQVFAAVLRNWRFFEFEPLAKVIDRRYDDYFDLELLHCDDREVVADVGAYVGDTFLSYVKNYGSGSYWRYYAYEITPDSFARLQTATSSYPRVICRRKGVGDASGNMALDSSGTDASANAVAASGDETVEVVALDVDLQEPITLLKMDIEGAEQSAITGCLAHIRQDKPKLALSVYHNFEDIWKLAKMVEDVAPEVYRFYLRYHGGNLWPSEITLLGIPAES